MKLFSTKTHGVLDYLTVGQLLALPRMMGWSDAVTRWMSGMALGTLVYSLATRYELGLVKLLPMKGHLTLDFLSGATFCAAPLLFPKEDTSVKATLVGLGLFEIMASLTTESQPSSEVDSPLVTEQLSEMFDQDASELRERTLGA